MELNSLFDEFIELLSLLSPEPVGKDEIGDNKDQEDSNSPEMKRCIANLSFKCNWHINCPIT